MMFIARTRRLAWLVVLLAAVIGALGVAVAAAGLFDPQPEICDNVHRGLGGCDDDQPQFSGTTCDDVGREFGTQLDARVVKILDGPDVVDHERKSARISSTEFLLVTRANQHLRRVGIVQECGLEDFLAAAEPVFSEKLRAQVGNYLFEFEEHTYDEWLANLRKTLRAIDMDEDEPA